MKPSPVLFSRHRRLPLTTKQVNNGFYKGTGSGAMGRHTKHGGYVIEWQKVRNYVVPDGLKDFKLTPFVTKTAEPVKSERRSNIDGEKYLQKWKEENGHD